MDKQTMVWKIIALLLLILAIASFVTRTDDLNSLSSWFIWIGMLIGIIVGAFIFYSLNKLGRR